MSWDRWGMLDVFLLTNFNNVGSWHNRIRCFPWTLSCMTIKYPSCKVGYKMLPYTRYIKDTKSDDDGYREAQYGSSQDFNVVAEVQCYTLLSIIMDRMTSWMPLDVHRNPRIHEHLCQEIYEGGPMCFFSQLLKILIHNTIIHTSFHEHFHAWPLSYMSGKVMLCVWDVAQH